MATERQIAANRLNARLSKGHRTAEGKRQSSGNALTHGLMAKTNLIAGENPDELPDMRERLFEELIPKSALELELVNRIVGIVWRLRRVPAFEAALLVWIEARERTQSTHILNSPRLPGDPGSPSAHESGKNQLVLGRSIEAFLKKDLSGKLGPIRDNLAKAAVGAVEGIAGDASSQKRD